MLSLHVHSSGLVSAIENVHGNTIDRILMPNRELGPRTDEAYSTVGTLRAHTEKKTHQKHLHALLQSDPCSKFLITVVTLKRVLGTVRDRENINQKEM